MKNLLLTGLPGIGKTTIVKRLLGLISLKADGFYTEEIRENGIRVGFRIITLDGREGILAHINYKSHFQVGKYRVNIEDLENIGVDAIYKGLKSRELIIIDEIGKMELFSNKFREAVIYSLDSPKKVVATIKEKDDAFIKQIKLRKDVKLVYVSMANRDSVPIELNKLLSQGI